MTLSVYFSHSLDAIEKILKKYLAVLECYMGKFLLLLKLVGNTMNTSFTFYEGNSEKANHGSNV